MWCCAESVHAARVCDACLFVPVNGQSRIIAYQGIAMAGNVVFHWFYNTFSYLTVGQVAGGSLRKHESGVFLEFWGSQGAGSSALGSALGSLTVDFHWFYSVSRSHGRLRVVFVTTTMVCQREVWRVAKYST